MSLTNEKEKIKGLVLSGGTAYEWPGIERERDSYFIRYGESAHTSDILEVYDSENAMAIGRKLQEMWEQKELKKAVPFIMSALKKCGGESEGRFGEIELDNYMM